MPNIANISNNILTDSGVPTSSLQPTITLTTTGTSGASTLISNTLNIPNYGSALTGYVPTSRQLTINGTAYDLSADRTWSVGTVTSVAALTLGTTGTDLSSSVATGTTTPVITLNVPTASAANRGALSAADWSTFNTKVGGVTATTPLFSSGGSTPNLTIQQSSGSQAGYLSSTDWTTFNSKQPAGNYITSLTGEATATGPGAAAVTLDNAAVTGKILTGVNITGGTILSTDSILTGFGKLQNQVNGLIGGSIYQGTWNANTNTPTLTSSVGTAGYYYIVSVAGTTNLNGITDWQVGDWAIFNGGVWQKVDNTDSVISVNGQTGAVSLTTDNISEGVTNLYYTNTRARASLSFVAGSGAYNSSTGAITIPTNTSQLTNGANFITLASLSGTAPITYNSATGAISITQAGTASNGYLSSTDWNTFNNKQATITLTTTGTSGASTLVGATLNIPQYQGVLTNPVTGTGTTNTLAKFTGTSTIGNSIISESGSAITIAGNLNIGSLGSLSINAGSAATPLLTQTTNDTEIYRRSGGVGIYLGGTGNAANYYDNTVHNFRTSGGGATRMIIDASGNLTVGSTAGTGTGALYAGAATFTGALSGTSASFSSTATASAFIPSGATVPTNGMYLSAANTLNFATASTNRVVINSSGNLGLGVTPSAWNTAYSVMQVGSGGSIVAYKTSNANELFIGANVFENTSGIWTYLQTASASQYLQINGSHVWRNAPSGTAGNAITFTQAMTLAAAGSLGVGTPTPTNRLQIYASAITTNDWNTYSARFSNNSDKGVIIGYDTTNSVGHIGSVSPGVAWTPLSINTNGGNVLIGTSTDAGYKLDVNGTGRFYRNDAANTSLTIANAYINQGNLINFQHNTAGTTTNGYIGHGGDNTGNFVILNNGITALSFAKATGAATFSSSVTATQFTSQGGRGTSYGFQLPDWQIYNKTSGNALAITNYTNDCLTLASTGAATFSSTITATAGIFSTITSITNGDQSGARLTIANTGTGGQTINLIAGNPNVDNTGFSIAYGNINMLRFATSGAATFLYGVTANAGLEMGGQVLAFNQSGTRSWSVQATGGNLRFQSGDNLGAFSFGSNVLIGTTTDAGNKLDVVGEARIQGGGAVSYAAFNLLDNTASGSNWAIFSGYPALGDFTIRESGVANQLIIKKTTGNATFIGSVTASSFFESSDMRIKTLIQDNYQTKGIASITPKLYTKNGKVELGYYAQDLVGILDSAVSKGSDEMLSLSYREVHTAKIYALEQEIKELKAKLN